MITFFPFFLWACISLSGKGRTNPSGNRAPAEKKNYIKSLSKYIYILIYILNIYKYINIFLFLFDHNPIIWIPKYVHFNASMIRYVLHCSYQNPMFCWNELGLGLVWINSLRKSDSPIKYFIPVFIFAIKKKWKLNKLIRNNLWERTNCFQNQKPYFF